MGPSKHLAVPLAILVALSACHRPGDGRVEVRNEAAVAASDIVVRTGGLTLPMETLEPGDASTQWFRAIEDSSLHMRYRLRGDAAPRKCWGDVYVTSLGGERLVVTVLNDGTCRVERVVD